MFQATLNRQGIRNDWGVSDIPLLVFSHCEERGDEAISRSYRDCFASLAMTENECVRAARSHVESGRDGVQFVISSWAAATIVNTKEQRRGFPRRCVSDDVDR